MKEMGVQKYIFKFLICMVIIKEKKMETQIFFMFLFVIISCIKTVQSISCFSCNGTLSPGGCNNTVQCGFGEVCAIQKLVNMTYNTGCFPQTNCTSMGRILIGKRDIFNTRYQFCQSCCYYDNCNNVGCGSEEEECKKYLGKGYFYDSVTQICAKVVKSNNKFNYSEAESNCRKDNARMIMADTKDKQQFLLSWIYTHPKIGDFWIGLTKNSSDGYRYHWFDNQPMNWENWGNTFQKQPSDVRTGNEDCVYLDSNDNFQWHDGRCDEPKSGFICEIWNITNKNLGSHCRRKVFDGYLYDSATNMCLKLKDSNTLQYTHDDAAKYCAGEPGATLVRVFTKERTDVITRWIYSNHANSSDYWIGLKDVTNSSKFEWVDGSNTTNYNNWGGPDRGKNKVSQPHRTGLQDCVYMSKDFNYTWFAERCDENKTGFICQHFPTASEKGAPGGGCFNRLSKGYFYDLYTKTCVKVFSGGSWDRNAAHNECNQTGDNLLEISNQNVDNYVQYLIRSLGQYSITDFWIGAKYYNNNNGYLWQHENSTITYENWYKFSARPKNCVVLDQNDSYRWAPKECGFRAKGFICELDTEAFSDLLLNKTTII